MSQSRNTKVVSALTYLDWIQRGSTEHWRRLYKLCKDPKVAQQVAAVLPRETQTFCRQRCFGNFFWKTFIPNWVWRLTYGQRKKQLGYSGWVNYI